MPNRVMTHMVAWFPDRRSSLEFARGLIDGGGAILEIQFPFSDPTADGRSIQEACKRALAEGFSVARGFDLVREITGGSKIPVFIMCYANTIFVHGIRRFLKRCKDAGVRGVIVPDLPVDYDEGLFSLCEEAGIQAVPVVSPSISDSRLEMVLSGTMEYVYATLRKGITGSFTEVAETQLGFLKRVEFYGKKTFAGFGISEKRQVDAIAPYVHAAVVGSCFIDAILRNEESDVYDTVRRTMASLI